MINKKGQTVYLTIVAGLFIFLFGILFLSFIISEKDIAIGSQGVNCDNANISDGAKLTCLGLETVVPYIIAAIGGVAFASIVTRFRK